MSTLDNNNNFKIDLSKFNKIDKPLIEPLNYDFASQNKALNQIYDNMREQRTKKEEYKSKVLETLCNIEKNTSNLNTVVELIKDSNENQEEIINIITELLMLSKETNQEEARSKFKKIMNKITNIKDSADTINQLVTLGSTIYAVLKANGIV